MADISNKERFRQRYAKRNPDLNMDDEEAYYGSVNQFLDEYEGCLLYTSSLYQTYFYLFCLCLLN